MRLGYFCILLFLFQSCTHLKCTFKQCPDSKNIAEDPSDKKMITNELIANEILENNTDTIFIFRNEGASLTTDQRLRMSAFRCEGFLNKEFSNKAMPLEIIMYESRADFVKGLQQNYGYPSEYANRYRNSMCPQPQKGKFVIPSDLANKSVCHEIVHHYLQTQTNHQLIKESAKWFDEGMATYFSTKLMDEKNIEESMRFLKNKNEFLMLGQMDTQEEWSELSFDEKYRKLVYSEAMLLVKYFVEDKYSPEKLNELLSALKDGNLTSFQDAFVKVTNGQSVDAFFIEWMKHIETTRKR